MDNETIYMSAYASNQKIKELQQLGYKIIFILG